MVFKRSCSSSFGNLHFLVMLVLYHLMLGLWAHASDSVADKRPRDFSHPDRIHLSEHIDGLDRLLVGEYR